ncbi:MerR family DNA-binding transcriptional regulator, partial [Bacillus subtilis]
MVKLTVKELSNIANVTIKTLYHYHKIGLLAPKEISEAGYWYYGADELKRLQEWSYPCQVDSHKKPKQPVCYGILPEHTGLIFSGIVR